MHYSSPSEPCCLLNFPRSKTDVPFYAFKSSYHILARAHDKMAPGCQMPGSGTIWYIGQIKHP
eukprot:scaffold8869_cov82-Skeletonema_menzelii.AAC.2